MGGPELQERDSGISFSEDSFLVRSLIPARRELAFLVSFPQNQPARLFTSFRSCRVDPRLQNRLSLFVSYGAALVTTEVSCFK